MIEIRYFFLKLKIRFSFDFQLIFWTISEIHQTILAEIDSFLSVYNNKLNCRNSPQE